MKPALAISAISAFFLVALGACNPRPSSGVTPIEWRLEGASEVRVLSVMREERTVDDRTGRSAEISIDVEGRWSKPRVFGDGVELPVGGWANSFSADVWQTSVDVVLHRGKTPKSLLVLFDPLSPAPTELRLALSP